MHPVQGVVPQVLVLLAHLLLPEKRKLMVFNRTTRRTAMKRTWRIMMMRFLLFTFIISDHISNHNYYLYIRLFKIYL